MKYSVEPLLKYYSLLSIYINCRLAIKCQTTFTYYRFEKSQTMLIYRSFNFEVWTGSVCQLQIITNQRLNDHFVKQTPKLMEFKPTSKSIEGGLKFTSLIVCKALPGSLSLANLPLPYTLLVQMTLFQEGPVQ